MHVDRPCVPVLDDAEACADLFVAIGAGSGRVSEDPAERTSSLGQAFGTELDLESVSGEKLLEISAALRKQKHLGWTARSSRRPSLASSRHRSRGKARGGWGQGPNEGAVLAYLERLQSKNAIMVKDANCVREGDAGEGAEIPIRVSVFAQERRDSGRGWPPWP